MHELRESESNFGLLLFSDLPVKHDVLWDRFPSRRRFPSTTNLTNTRCTLILITEGHNPVFHPRCLTLAVFHIGRYTLYIIHIYSFFTFRSGLDFNALHVHELSRRNARHLLTRIYWFTHSMFRASCHCIVMLSNGASHDHDQVIGTSHGGASLNSL